MIRRSASIVLRPSRVRRALDAAVMVLLAAGAAEPSAAPSAAPSAQQFSPAADRTWRAQWIGVADAMRVGEPHLSLPNLWIAFRKRVTLEAPPRRALARIACDSKYWLWINGELAVFEGQLKRGPTREDTYFDTVDLTPYLRPGVNTIAVLVWHWGGSAYSHRSSGRAGLVFDADVDGRPLPSDSTWKALVHPAYGSTGPPHPNTALPEPNIRFDARADIAGWHRPGYDDSDWPAADEFARPPVAPWNRLVPRPIPLWRDSGLRAYPEVREVHRERDGRQLVARLPYDAQITPYLEVDAPAGREIRIRTDAYTEGGRPTVRSVYITREGVQAYESLGWMSGHEVRYTIPSGVEVLALKYRETGYDADFAGEFRSDDAALNTLWTKARRTLYVNMRDSHMDSPDRERAQWWADLVSQLGQAVYALDAERGPLLARKGIYELVNWRRGDGVMMSPIPFGPGMESSEIPMQMLAAVGWYGFWTYYRYTGDRRTVADAYPAVRDYLRLWRMGEDGLVVHRAGGWDWADLGEHADVAVLENAWYHLALRAAAEMARLAGHAGDVPQHEARMRSIEAAFDDLFWRGDAYRSTSHEGETDDRANAMAVVAGLAPRERYPAIREVLRSQMHASPYMEKYVLEALFLMDAPGQAIDRMKERWAEQIASPLTTLWEQWELREWNGYNHGWSGGPLTLLHRYAAGVAPIEPGYERYAVRPRMGPLRWIRTRTPTPRGPIELALRRYRDGLRTHLTSPPGTDAVAAVPVGGVDAETVTVNGEVVWRKDGTAHRGPIDPDADAGDLADPGAADADAGDPGAGDAGAAGVRLVAADDRRIELALPPGRWVIEALAAPREDTTPAGPPVFDEPVTLSENPVRSGRLVIRFRERPAAAVVFTPDGRRVVNLLRHATGDRRIQWDLTNGRGARLAPGVYLAVFDVEGERVRKKLFVVRPRE